jgi:hypothetical protein
MPRMLARLGRAFLVVAMLLAQHTALAHDLWHAVGAPSSQAPQAPGGKANKLCDLHDLLGTVLGIASGAAPIPAFLDVADTPYVAGIAAIRQAPRFAPRSRDPPLVS